MDEGSKSKWQNAISVTMTNELGHTDVQILLWKDERFVFMGHEFNKDGVKSLIN